MICSLKYAQATKIKIYPTSNNLLCCSNICLTLVISLIYCFLCAIFIIIIINKIILKDIINNPGIEIS